MQFTKTQALAEINTRLNTSISLAEFDVIWTRKGFKAVTEEELNALCSTLEDVAKLPKPKAEIPQPKQPVAEVKTLQPPTQSGDLVEQLRAVRSQLETIDKGLGEALLQGAIHQGAIEGEQLATVRHLTRDIAFAKTYQNLVSTRLNQTAQELNITDLMTTLESYLTQSNIALPCQTLEEANAQSQQYLPEMVGKLEKQTKMLAQVG